MKSILLRTSESESIVAELWELGTCGIVEESNGIRAFFEEDQVAEAAHVRFGDFSSELRTESLAMPVAFSHDQWEPICVGQRFFIAPSWVDQPTPRGRLRLTVDSVTAFGTGRHETTQLALEYMEENIRPGQTVIDVGCGSGILSHAACLLGAKCVLACDIDELAVSAATELLHGSAFVGSADALQTECADLLLVNISAKVIESLAGELKRVLKPGGTFLATGFISVRKPACLLPTSTRERNDWCCAIGDRNSIVAPERQPGAIVSHDPQWW